MAHLVRPWIVSYVDAAGRRVPKGTPGARKRRVRSAKWYAQGVPGYPPKKRIPLATQKGVSQRMLADLISGGEKQLAGMADPFAIHRHRPLTDHLEDFHQFLLDKGDTAEQAAQVKARVSKVLTGCGFKVAGDLDAPKLAEYLAARRRGDIKDERALSVQTSNFYLAAAKQFCTWLVRNRRLAENPFAFLQGGNPDTDRRHDRRSLSEPELVKLLEAAGGSTITYREMTGTDRVMIYTLAMMTGFRAGELRALTPHSFHLDGTPPVVAVEAGQAKNRKHVTQPIPAALVNVLRSYMKGRGDGPLFPTTWDERAAEMLQIDLEAAGIPYKLDGPNGPLFADFHALRHSYITLMERSGISVKHAQTLARHSDVNLTLARYTHAALADLGDAVNRLPVLHPAADKALAPLGAAAERDAIEALAGFGMAFFWAVCGVAPLAPPLAPNRESAWDGLGRIGTTDGDTAAA